MFCSLEELHTESDVEQKLLWPLLTTGVPNGTGLVSADILTKLSIRRLEIGKGSSRKLYYPDYMVVIAGLPVLVIEAKAPGESVEQALAEARLYATELNALFPSGINPCTRIVACNGAELLSAPVDTADHDIKLKHSDISVGSALYAQLIDKCRRAVLQKHADEIRARFRNPNTEGPSATSAVRLFRTKNWPRIRLVPRSSETMVMSLVLGRARSVR